MNNSGAWAFILIFTAILVPLTIFYMYWHYKHPRSYKISSPVSNEAPGTQDDNLFIPLTGHIKSYDHWARFGIFYMLIPMALLLCLVICIPSQKLMHSFMITMPALLLIDFGFFQQMQQAKNILLLYHPDEATKITLDPEGMTIPIIALVLHSNVEAMIAERQKTIRVNWENITEWRITNGSRSMPAQFLIREGQRDYVAITRKFSKEDEKKLLDYAQQHLAITIQYLF